MTTSVLPPALGVCIVTYNAADVITGCLATLFAAENVRLRVVVVDNASSDGTVARIRNWAAGTIPPEIPLDLPFESPHLTGPVALHEALPSAPLDDNTTLTMLHAPVNGGFAAGVNLGLDHLMQDLDIDRFWILNPDCVVPPGTPAALAAHPAPPGSFALIGGRVSYLSPAGRIQSDGGRINWLTGMTINVNRGRATAQTSPPSVDTLDFISGASMVASRAFLEQAGLMPEDYFLYYEEVDWALRRGALPLLYCNRAPVYHHAGSTIGSGSVERVSTDFSVYFLYRARMRFLRRHCPRSLPVAFFYSLAKAVQHALRGQWAQFHALLRAINGLRPPAAVRKRLSPETRAIIDGAREKSYQR
ncbi:MAG: glycosyltransferase family 2 protein [Wenzhouxiangella sp.]